MDHARFDRWTRLLARGATRRRTLAALTALVAGGTAAGRRPTAARSADVDFSGIFCGGFAAIPCPGGYACVDDPGDLCDPEAGGADCGGRCVRDDGEPTNPCAAILCQAGSTCCPNCGGICVPAGVPCSDDFCPGVWCGPVRCGPGEHCCNESCGICTPVGGVCTQQYCGAIPADVPW